MPKKKNIKNNKRLVCFGVATAILGVLVVILGVVLMNKSAEKRVTDRYMDYYPYLLNQRVQEVCASQREEQDKRLDCRFVEYDIDDENNPFVRYIIVELDDNYEIIEGSEKTYKLTLWQDESQKTVPGNWGVSEANGVVDE